MVLYSCKFRNSIHEFEIKVHENICLIYALDCFQRWFVHIYFVFEGFLIDDYKLRAGGASDYWIADHFEADH